jgi:hypothetical protein
MQVDSIAEYIYSTQYVCHACTHLWLLCSSNTTSNCRHLSGNNVSGSLDAWDGFPSLQRLFIRPGNEALCIDQRPEELTFGICIAGDLSCNSPIQLLNCTTGELRPLPQGTVLPSEDPSSAAAAGDAQSAEGDGGSDFPVAAVVVPIAVAVPLAILGGFLLLAWRRRQRRHMDAEAAMGTAPSGRMVRRRFGLLQCIYSNAYAIRNEVLRTTALLRVWFYDRLCVLLGGSTTRYSTCRAIRLIRLKANRHSPLPSLQRRSPPSMPSPSPQPRVKPAVEAAAAKIIIAAAVAQTRAVEYAQIRFKVLCPRRWRRWLPPQLPLVPRRCLVRKCR